MRIGRRVVWVPFALLAALACTPARAEAPAEIDQAARDQLKQDVRQERFEGAEKTLEEWRRHNLEATTGKPLLGESASMSDLQTAFNESLDAGHYGVAQYYLEQIRTKAENPDIFKPALDLTIWTIVIFLLLLAVLYKFAWTPMMTGLQKRETDIHGAVEDARTARDEAQRLRGEVQTERTRIEEMRREIIQKAQADAQRTAEDVMNKAKADMQAERERLRREIETARDQALQEIWRQAADLAAMVSTKAIRRNLTPDDHRRFVDEALAELRQAGNGRQTPASV